MINIKLFWIFLQIGTFTLGGGPAMIPVVRDKIVEKEKMITENEFIDIIAMSSGLPGAIIINIATFIGNKISGFRGALFSAIGAVLPAYISIIFLSMIFNLISDAKIIKYIFLGVRPSIIFLLAISMYQIAEKTYTKKTFLVGIAIFLIIFAFDISSVVAIVALGVYGLVEYFWESRKKC